MRSSTLPFLVLFLRWPALTWSLWGHLNFGEPLVRRFCGRCLSFVPPLGPLLSARRNLFPPFLPLPPGAPFRAVRRVGVAGATCSVWCVPNRRRASWRESPARGSARLRPHVSLLFSRFKKPALLSLPCAEPEPGTGIDSRGLRVGFLAGRVATVVSFLRH